MPLRRSHGITFQLDVRNLRLANCMSEDYMEVFTLYRCIKLFNCVAKVSQTRMCVLKLFDIEYVIDLLDLINFDLIHYLACL